MTDFYDSAETRHQAEREQALLLALPHALRHAVANAPAVARQLQGVDATHIHTREALSQLPVIRKSDLLTLQTEARMGGAAFEVQRDVRERVFGGFSAVGWGSKTRRVFASPGPLYEPEGSTPDYWRFARALFAAGFRSGDLVHNCFSYHFTPAGSMFETAAHALGCTVFPAGVGQTEQQVQAILDLEPSGYTGTPSFLKIILEKADELGVNLPSIKRALVSGEAFPPSLRDWFIARDIQAYQAYGSADLGMIAYETSARDGLVLSEDLLLEIVRPGTGAVLPEGEVGEVVITALNTAYPLVRFGTGDLSAILPGVSPCGRTNTRIRGWLGRADQTTKVRGMFVHPAQVAQVIARYPELIKARLVVSGRMGSDQMTLKVECTSQTPALATRLEQTVRDVTKLRADIEFVDPNQLPNDGKVIEDVRAYD
jgi:phenylacetate-CoA ligase